VVNKRKSKKIAEADGSRKRRTAARPLRRRIGVSVWRDTRIETCTSSPDDILERYRSRRLRWTLVASGYWRQGVYHSGYVSYYLARASKETWLLDCVERNADLDGVTEDDVEDGGLNDDQLQAMWGMSLAEAQNAEYRRIVAMCSGAPARAKRSEVARRLYEAVRKAGGKSIEESDDKGILL